MQSQSIDGSSPNAANVEVSKVHKQPRAMFQLLDTLPTELVLDVFGVFLRPATTFTRIVCLSNKFRSLVKSDSLCRRQLVQLYFSVEHLSEFDLTLFTDLTRWPGFDSLYSLLRGIAKFIQLVGHWRSTNCYLGQLLCFTLDVEKQSITGTHVETDYTIPLIEIKLLPDRPSESFYLEIHPDAAPTRHQCILTPYRNSLRSNNSAASLNPRLAGFAAPILPSSFDRSLIQSFSIACHSLPTRNRLNDILHLHQLQTPAQRRYFPLYYPNPHTVMHRLPINMKHTTSVSVDVPQAPFPPAGLYVGSYGPHGQEIMNLEYDTVRREMVASKILGDANVPSGQVSYRVSLPEDVWPNQLQWAQRQSPIACADVSDDDDDSMLARVAHFRRPLVPHQVPDLPILAINSGSGTISQRGFDNPQTVDVHCFFHPNAEFSLQFLGVIAFKPFRCPCHVNYGSSQRDVTNVDVED